MGYFDERKNVEQYLQLADGYDGRELIAVLRKHLPVGSSLLELGMGPGKDLDMMSETYKTTGSDSSKVFLDLYRETHPSADLLLLDAITLKTDRTFDCIYSNKVLHHLTRSDLRSSFRRQWELLNDGGLLFHSFWHGAKEEEFDGLRFIYYDEDALPDLIGSGFEIVETCRYTEMESDDSFYALLRKS